MGSKWAKYRRAWAEEHFQNYLRKRAEIDVREAARVFHVKSAERGGKPPTPKQFTRTAAVPTDRWFGGDASALYRAFGERFPVSPVRVRIVPGDVEGFVARVYAALGGIEVSASPEGFDLAAREKHNQEISDNHRKAELANRSLDYLRLEESLGRPPSLKEFGRGSFANRAAEAGLGADAETAWTAYERIVRDALVSTEGIPQEGGHHEQRESPTAQSIDEDEVAGTRPAFDTSTQCQPESKQEKSWWKRLFGR